MYEAYAHQRVVFRMPMEICALATHDSQRRLFAAHKTGQLLTFTPSRDGKFEFTICKKFESKAIQQLKTIESHNSILCLADNQLTVHDLTEVVTVKATLKYRGITCFDAYVDEQTNKLYVAIAANRRIYVLEWIDNDFRELPIKFYDNKQFLENAESLTWCGKSRVAFSIKGEYWIVQVLENLDDRRNLQERVGQLQTLFCAGNKLEKPLIIDFPDREVVGFCRDDEIVFSTYHCKRAKKYDNIKFESTPKALAYDSPYLLAILDKGVIEVRSLVPSMLIQRIQLLKARTLCSSRPGHVFVCSASDVWLLNSHSLLTNNINSLVAERQYVLAIQLAEMCDFVDPRHVVDIKRKAAFHFFCQNNFSECFRLHTEIKSDVCDVIALFSGLLPEEFRSKFLIEHPPDLNENEARKGYSALAQYLTLVRSEVSQAIEAHKRDTQNGLSDRVLDEETLKSHENTLQIIDTTLLQCYVYTVQKVFLGSLLRLRDNSCWINESVQVLQRAGMYPELFLLYQQRSLHDKALELLKTEARNRDSPLQGIDKTVEYLQTLGNEHLHLIFQYASWVLAENYEKGLTIFTSNSEDVTRDLDREAVLQFLMRECMDAIIPYLEHLVYKWGEKRPKFHETLAQSYIAKVKAMLRDYIHILADNDNVIRGGTEEGELGVYRKKLIELLESSKSYSVDKVYNLLGTESFWEERAVLLGAQNKFDEALYLYTSVLFDFAGAERFCRRHYDPNDQDKSQVFLKLVKAYTQPTNMEIPGLKRRVADHPKPNVAEALKILKKYAESMDTVQAIYLLPKETKLKGLWSALEGVLQSTDANKKEKEVRSAMSRKTVEKLLAKFAQISNQKVRIDSRALCYECRKTIGNAAFVRRPDDGFLAHFGCYVPDDKKEDLGG